VGGRGLYRREGEAESEQNQTELIGRDFSDLGVPLRNLGKEG
jgi:hypothetical protein